MLVKERASFSYSDCSEAKASQPHLLRLHHTEIKFDPHFTHTNNYIFLTDI